MSATEVAIHAKRQAISATELRRLADGCATELEVRRLILQNFDSVTGTLEEITSALQHCDARANELMGEMQ
jgi:hypothetical protein